jgi:hypothetical protein
LSSGDVLDYWPLIGEPFQRSQMIFPGGAETGPCRKKHPFKNGYAKLPNLLF